MSVPSPSQGHQQQPPQQKDELVEFLKNFDVFPKTMEDAKELSSSGGTVSVIVFGIMFLLFMSETSMYLTKQTLHTMEVDTARGGILQINFEVEFPRMPCSVLSLDSMDVSGDHELDVVKDVFKQKLDKSGKKIGDPITNKTKISHKTSDIESIKKELLDGMGCNLYGTLQAQKVAGNFHMSLHAQDFQVLAHVFPNRQLANMSHLIHHLSFGTKYPGMKNPLDGERRVIAEGTGSTEYYIKIVPTIFHHLNSRKDIYTNQYSVTDHFRKQLDGFPALYFVYDINPLMVRVTEQTQSFLHYATQLCAITGGMFVVVGQLHRLCKLGMDQYLEMVNGRAKGLLS